MAGRYRGISPGWSLRKWVVLLLTVLLLRSVALPAAADRDPFSGKWRAIDADYSNWKMTITASEQTSVRSTMKDPNIARRYEALVDSVAGDEEH